MATVFIPASTSALLLDIEGTTTPITFVKVSHNSPPIGSCFVLFFNCDAYARTMLTIAICPGAALFDCCGSLQSCSMVTLLFPVLLYPFCMVCWFIPIYIILLNRLWKNLHTRSLYGAFKWLWKMSEKTCLIFPTVSSVSVHVCALMLLITDAKSTPEIRYSKNKYCVIILLIYELSTQVFTPTCRHFLFLYMSGSSYE